MPEGWVEYGGDGEIAWVWGKFKKTIQRTENERYWAWGAYELDEWDVIKGDIYFYSRNFN